MSLVQMNFESQYLGCNHEISVILPDNAATRGQLAKIGYLVKVEEI